MDPDAAALIPSSAPAPAWMGPLARFDEQGLAWVQARRSPFSDQLSVFLKMLGDGRYTLPPTFLLYFVAEYRGWTLLQSTCGQAAASFLISGIIIQTIHALTRRHRPDRDDGPLVFEGPAWRSKHRSFPSGHSTVSWALFSVFALRLSAWWPVSVIAVLLALLTAYSRLNDRAHWPSDVIVGSLIGFGTAVAVVRWM